MEAENIQRQAKLRELELDYEDRIHRLEEDIRGIELKKNALKEEHPVH